MGAIKSSKPNTKAKILTGITICAILAITAPLLKGDVGGQPQIHNVTVAGIILKELSPEQARLELQKQAVTLQSQPVQVDVCDTTGKRLWGRVYTRQELGYKLDVPATVQSAIEASNPQGLWQKILLAYSHRSGVAMESKYISDTQIARAVAKRIGKLVNRPPVDAKITGISAGTIVSTPEQTGYHVPDTAGPELHTAALQGLPRVVIQCEEEPAKITQASLRFTPVVLASATTKYSSRKVARTKNVVMAANNMNNTVVVPGAEFSYNKAVGPRSLEEGFVEALIFVKGKVVPGAGGGVCQVSTTLFQALLKTGLEIKERHPHSLPVTYAKPGLDATVSYGAIDLRFLNNYDKPVIVHSRASGGLMTVTLLGDASCKGQYKVVQEGLKVTKLPAKVVYSNKLPAGKRVVENKSVTGYRVTTYRVKLEGGKEIERKLIDHDVYRPQSKVVVEGTAKAQPSANPTTGSAPQEPGI